MLEIGRWRCSAGSYGVGMAVAVCVVVAENVRFLSALKAPDEVSIVPADASGV